MWCIYASVNWAIIGQIMACCLLSNKSISFPMQAYCRLDLWKTNFSKIWINKTIFLQYNEFEYVICKMAAFCLNLIVYLYLYLYLMSCICICICIWSDFSRCICICICIWNFGKKMYLYLIKRIWPQPWTHWGITTLQMNSSVFKPHEWAPFQSNYNFTLTHDQYKVECLL